MNRKRIRHPKQRGIRHATDNRKKVMEQLEFNPNTYLSLGASALALLAVGIAPLLSDNFTGDDAQINLSLISMLVGLVCSIVAFSSYTSFLHKKNRKKTGYKSSGMVS